VSEYVFTQTDRQRERQTQGCTASTASDLGQSRISALR